MPAELKSLLLEDYLGRVRSHLPLSRAKDIVRELESSIRDRIDDIASSENRAPDEDVVRRALAEMGEPEKVAGAYVTERALIPPEDFRAFLVYTATLFAVHLALVGVATTLARPLQFGPVAIAPVGPQGLLSVGAAAVHALLVDVGLTVLLFAGASVFHRRIGAAAKSVRVDTSVRGAGTRVLLAVLVALVLNVFRDRVFVVVLGNLTYPLFTEWFAGVMPLVTALLGLSILSDVLYLVLGERRFTLAVDALHGVAAVACMLYLLRGDAILALPGVESFANFHAPVNDFLNQLGTLVVGFLALVFAVKTVKRLVRFAQM
jgi:hypothetical protein